MIRVLFAVSGASSLLTGTRLQIDTSNIPHSQVVQLPMYEVPSFIDLTGDDVKNTECLESTIEYHDGIATKTNGEIINLVDTHATVDVESISDGN